MLLQVYFQVCVTSAIQAHFHVLSLQRHCKNTKSSVALLLIHLVLIFLWDDNARLFWTESTQTVVSPVLLSVLNYRITRALLNLEHIYLTHQKGANKRSWVFYVHFKVFCNSKMNMHSLSNSLSGTCYYFFPLI